MKIYIGNDHAGPETKLAIIKYLESKGYEVEDCGVGKKEKADYPDIAQLVSEKVLSEKDSLGVLVCGTGIGMAIKANRNKGIRAAVLDNSFAGKAAKEHNNANVICFGSRITPDGRLQTVLDSFFNAEFEGGRHIARLEKLD